MKQKQQQIAQVWRNLLCSDLGDHLKELEANY